MKIAHIVIKNHARVADLDLSCRDHVVLVGPNASGKTTILHLLDAVLGARPSWLNSRFDTRDLRERDEPILVEVCLVDLDAQDRAHFAGKAQAGTGDKKQEWLTIRLTAKRSSVDEDELDIDRSFVRPQVADVRVTNPDIDRIGWTLVAATRAPDRELGRSRSGVVRSLLHSVDLASTEQEMIGGAYEALTQALQSTESLASLRADLATELGRLFPTTVEPGDVHIDLPEGAAETPLDGLDVLLSDSTGSRFSLNEQSDGLRSLSVLAAQLLASRSARILAIDEPELHLHPRSQANLARSLASSGGQRILSTHAPAVLTQFAPVDVVAVTQSGCRQLGRATLDTKSKTYQHWWVDGPLEPLTAQRVILVEGVSDRILVEAVATHLKCDLHRKGVTVFSLGGASNFASAIRLFGPTGFDLPLLGLVDEAEASIPAKALNVDPSDLGDHHFEVCRTDLEEEYVRALGVSAVIDLLDASGLFTEKAILKRFEAATADDVDQNDLLGLLRKKKVEAATALAETMTLEQATSIVVLKDLVEMASAD